VAVGPLQLDREAVCDDLVTGFQALTPIPVCSTTPDRSEPTT
jgi:hypothetical protein